MKPEKFTAFPIARYRLVFQVTQAFSLPEYAGSALRGAFGRALRKISCMTKQAECKGCPLYRTCPYTNIFETPAPTDHPLQKFSQVPNGYIIEPPLNWGNKRDYAVGDMFTFDLVLFGKLREQLPLIAFAFKRALAYNLAGGKADLVDIAIYSQNMTACTSVLHQAQIIDHQAEIHLPETLPDKMTLWISTPLRLQENGVPLRENQISAERFLISLAKRISLLSEFHAKPLPLDFSALMAQIPQIQDEKRLYWQDWQRYSSRQNQKMTLGGVMGEWHFRHLSPEWSALIYLGQWLHNGKNTTFGLGKYEIV